MTTRTRAALAASTLLLLVGCSSGTDDADDEGVASVDPGGGSSSAGSSAGSGGDDPEAELLAYVECLRGEGVDVPDPTVDADGNLTLGQPDPEAGQDVDPDALADAQETCGELPEGALGGGEGVDGSAIEEAAVEFSRCMRSEGLDFPDPDLSGGLSDPTGLFPGVDLDDPDVQEAAETCQDVFAESGLGGGLG